MLGVGENPRRLPVEGAIGTEPLKVLGSRHGLGEGGVWARVQGLGLLPDAGTGWSTVSRREGK